MPRLIFDEREYEQLRTPLLQLSIEHPRTYMWHSDILLIRISDVNTGNLGHTIRFLGQEEKKNALNNRSFSAFDKRPAGKAYFAGFASRKSFIIGTIVDMRFIKVTWVVSGKIANLDAERGCMSPWISPPFRRYISAM